MNPTNKLKPLFDEHFKFAIGEIVTYAWVKRSLEGEAELNVPPVLLKWERAQTQPPPIALVVTGRLLEECHGGIQAHYNLRGRLNREGTEALVRHHEFELVAYEEALNVVRRMKPTREED